MPIYAVIKPQNTKAREDLKIRQRREISYLQRSNTFAAGFIRAITEAR